MPHAPPSMADAVLWPPQFSPRATGVRGCDATGDADHRRGAVACRPGTLTMGALKSSRILQPVHARFSILSPSWLWGLRDVAVLAGSPGCSQRRNGCSPAARTHLSAQYADRARRCHRGGYRSGPRRVTQKQAVQNGQSQCHPSRLGTSLLLTWRQRRSVMSSALAMPSIRSAARGSPTGELTAVKHCLQAWVCDSGCLMNEMVGTADGGRGGR